MLLSKLSAGARRRLRQPRLATERKREEKAEGEGEHDPLVSTTDAEEIA